jgi:signal transduction histidine kinase
MSLGRVGEYTPAAIIVIETAFAALGFLTTLLLQRVYGTVRVAAESSLRTMVLTGISSYVGGMLWTASFYYYLRHLAPVILVRLDAQARLPALQGPVLDNTVYNSLALLAWSALYVSLLNRDALQEQREQALRAVAEARDAQLRMLAYQLNPHFLFNTLNSLRALIDEDRGRARQMVTELAGFLRYSLVERPLQLTRLSEELEAVRGYLAIESIRFEERLEVRVEVRAEAEECLVPAFLLNPLVENALKHGAPAGPGQPLRVWLRGESAGGRLRISVENTGSLAPPAGGDRTVGSSPGRPERLLGAGVGLRNVRARLEHHYPGTHRLGIDEGDGVVRVSLDLPAVYPDAAARASHPAGVSQRAGAGRPAALGR